MANVAVHVRGDETVSNAVNKANKSLRELKEEAQRFTGIAKTAGDILRGAFVTTGLVMLKNVIADCEKEFEKLNPAAANAAGSATNFGKAMDQVKSSIGETISKVLNPLRSWFIDMLNPTYSATVALFNYNKEIDATLAKYKTMQAAVDLQNQQDLKLAVFDEANSLKNREIARANYEAQKKQIERDQSAWVDIANKLNMNPTQKGYTGNIYAKGISGADQATYVAATKALEDDRAAIKKWTESLTNADAALKSVQEKRMLLEDLLSGALKGAVSKTSTLSGEGAGSPYYALRESGEASYPENLWPYAAPMADRTYGSGASPILGQLPIGGDVTSLPSRQWVADLYQGLMRSSGTFGGTRFSLSTEAGLGITAAASEIEKAFSMVTGDLGKMGSALKASPLAFIFDNLSKGIQESKLSVVFNDVSSAAEEAGKAFGDVAFKVGNLVLGTFAAAIQWLMPGGAGGSMEMLNQMKIQGNISGVDQVESVKRAWAQVLKPSMDQSIALIEERYNAGMLTTETRISEINQVYGGLLNKAFGMGFKASDFPDLGYLYRRSLPGDLATTGSFSSGGMGSSTTIQHPPDINVFWTIEGNVIGAGGMQEAGKLFVDGIKAYLGTGARVTFLEA